MFCPIPSLGLGILSFDFCLSTFFFTVLRPAAVIFKLLSRSPAVIAGRGKRYYLVFEIFTYCCMALRLIGFYTQFFYDYTVCNSCR